MNAEELLQVESSQRQHYDTILYHERLNVCVEIANYNLFSILKPKLYKDGDKWCCLYGDDIIVGIAGFGDTPHKAIINFNRQWTEK